jgi:hypothetical protein
MKRMVMNREEIAKSALEDASAKGERVWDWSVHAREDFAERSKRVFSEPLVWTSQIGRKMRFLAKNPSEPDGWVVGRPNPDEWRLYLRIGEKYSETGIQYFEARVQVAARADDEFIRLSVLPKELWWQAPFSCPFCQHLCVEQKHCKHLMIALQNVQPPYLQSSLYKVFWEMWERQFNCSIHNAGIDGLVVKFPRTFSSLEWFRSAYWYVRDPSVADAVEEALRTFAKFQRVDPIKDEPS